MTASIALCVMLASVTAAAQDQPTVSRTVHSKLTKARQRIEDENYKGALKLLKPLRRKAMNDYEAQNVLSHLGFINYMLEDYPAAIEVYEDLLDIDAIDLEARKQSLYTLAQLYAIQKQHRKTLETMDQWFELADEPLPGPLATYAKSLMGLNRYEEMLEPVQQAIRLATEKGREVDRLWYEMLHFALIEKADREIEARQYDTALASLRDLDARSELTDEERLNVLTKTAYVHELRDESDLAIAAYEKTLLAPGLPDAGKKQIEARIAQLRGTVTTVVASSPPPADDAPDDHPQAATADTVAEAEPETEIVKTAPIRLIEERIALVIGNGAYETIDPLENPQNDVRLVSNALEATGFDVTLLIDADQQAMDEAVNDFALTLDQAGENAVGVFYYAGHGVSYDGQNWLIPVKSDIRQATHLKYRTLSANYVLEMMEEARNATDIIILDSCRNNPFRGFSLTGRRSLARGMGRMDIAPEGSLVVYSTAPGRVAYDGHGNYSAFAEAFASEVETTGESINDMLIDVRVRVKNATLHEELGPQIPWANSSLLGKFWFNPGKPRGGGNQILADQ
ncbi:MAG: caspase family protein [Gammaproteobacteria bacterium]|nr:caspase family protein [Gammaproteobacteria bacterium]